MRGPFPFSPLSLPSYSVATGVLRSLWVAQRRLIYFPSPPGAVGCGDFADRLDVRSRTTRRTPVLAWVFPGTRRPVLVHGTRATGR